MNKSENQTIGILLQQIKLGNESALMSLMTLMTPKLMTVGLAILKNHQDAEDCVQDTYVSIVEKSKTFRNNDNAAGWVYQIMRRKCLDKIRIRKREPNMTSDETIASQFNNFEFEQADDSLFIETLITKLDQEQREVILMRFWEDLTFRRIAKETHKPLVKIERIYKSALEKIKETVQKGAL